MTCRHSDPINNPQCSSYRTPAQQREDALKAVHELETKWGLIGKPDAENFDIVRAEQIGAHLVLKVQYPSCAECAYEGNKVMVFLGWDMADALRWKRIDPHFRPQGERPTREAPSPDARFPATDTGWQDAVDYCHRHSP